MLTFWRLSSWAWLSQMRKENILPASTPGSLTLNSTLRESLELGKIACSFLLKWCFPLANGCLYLHHRWVILSHKNLDCNTDYVGTYFGMTGVCSISGSQSHAKILSLILIPLILSILNNFVSETSYILHIYEKIHLLLLKINGCAVFSKKENTSLQIHAKT